METRVIPEIYLKRRTCENCGDIISEFGDIPEKNYICFECEVGNLMPMGLLLH